MENTDGADVSYAVAKHTGKINQLYVSSFALITELSLFGGRSVVSFEGSPLLILALLFVYSRRVRACVRYFGRAVLNSLAKYLLSASLPLFTLESPSITVLRPSRTDGSFPAIWRACTLRPFLTDKWGGGRRRCRQPELAGAPTSERTRPGRRCCRPPCQEHVGRV